MMVSFEGGREQRDWIGLSPSGLRYGGSTQHGALEREGRLQALVDGAERYLSVSTDGATVGLGRVFWE